MKTMQVGVFRLQALRAVFISRLLGSVHLMQRCPKSALSARKVKIHISIARLVDSRVSRVQSS